MVMTIDNPWDVNRQNLGFKDAHENTYYLEFFGEHFMKNLYSQI